MYEKWIIERWDTAISDFENLGMDSLVDDEVLIGRIAWAVHDVVANYAPTSRIQPVGIVLGEVRKYFGIDTLLWINDRTGPIRATSARDHGQ